MAPVLVKYRKLLTLALANNAILFTTTSVVGHRVQIKMSVDDLNTFFIWQRPSGSIRPVGHFLPEVNGVKFSEIILDSLNKNYIDLDGNTDGLNFSSYVFDANIDSRIRTSNKVSSNDLVMAYILYKCYGSSTCPTANVIYNLEDAQAILSSTSVSMSITSSFEEDEALSNLGGSDLGGVDAMFRNMLASAPLRFFQANGTQIPGLFETHFATSPSDPAGQGSWQFMENDTLELRICFTFQQPVSNESINESGIASSTTVIKAGDTFSIRLQILATDTSSGAAAKAVVAAAAAAAANTASAAARASAAAAALVAATEAQQQVNAASAQENYESEQLAKILLEEARQQINVTNSASILNIAQAALNSAILEGSSYQVIQHARTASLTAAATLAQNEATLLHLSTQMLQLTINHNVTVSTLNGKQAAAAQALLISATTNSLTAQAAYAAASASASSQASASSSASVSQSTLQLQMLLSNATDPTLLLNNKLAFITASNASMTTWSNALVAQANEQDALSQLTNAQQIMNMAIVLGNTSGIQIMMANVNAYSIIETTAKAALLSTNIALVNTAATEYTAYTTLISNSNLAANLSNLLATESYNSASLNLSTAISNLSTTIQSDSDIQALVSLSQSNLTSSVNGGGMVNDTLTSTLLGYTTIAMSSSAAVTRTNAASNAAQTILMSASSNVGITSSNLSTIVSNNAALFSTFSTSMVTMMNYENSVLANPSTINAAQAVNSAHITYNTMLENQELASNALLVAQRILDTTIANQGSPQQIALLQANVTTAQGKLNSANAALNTATTLYNSASLNATEDPNALTILNLAASTMAVSISTALNDQLANNLYSAISTQNSLTTVLNNASLDYTLATSALNNAITSGKGISEIQVLNSNLNAAKVAYTKATVLASASVLAVSTAQTNVTTDPSTMSILESAALISYSTTQGALANALVQQVTALYEESAVSIQSTLVAQLNYSTSICALMNAVAGGAGISTIQGLQAAVNSTSFVYAKTTQASIAIGTALINEEQIAVVNPLAQNIINISQINNGASAISQSVDTYAAALVTAQTQSASTLVAMQIAQNAYDTAISALDLEISSGRSISQIQAAQTTLQNAGASLATRTMNYNYTQSTLTQSSYYFSTFTAAYTSTLSQTNIVSLSQALTNVTSQVAQIAISVSTQTAAIASQEIVHLASIAYDSQSTFIASMTNLSTISSVTSMVQSTLTAMSVTSVSPTEISSVLSTFQSDSTQLALAVARTASAKYAYSTSQNTILNYSISPYLYAAIANYTDPVASVQPPPYQPTSITFTSVTSNGFTVNWTGGIAATSYTYSINGMPAVPTDSTSISSTSVYAKFSNLEENTLYTVIVTAVNSKGSTSSSPFTVTTRGVPPVQPIPSISNLTTTSVQIDWSGGDGVTSYSYSMNGSRVTPSIDNGLLSNFVVFTELASNRTYVIVVIAENTYGSTSSSPITLTTLIALPTQPNALTPSPITPSGFTIGWTGGVGSTSYSYTLNGSPVTPSIDNGMTAQTATFTLLQPSTSYTLIITSTNSTGSISSSPCVILTSPATIPPSAPNLTRSFTYSTLHVSWIGGIGATSFSFVLNGVATVPSSSTGSSADFTGLTPSTSYTLVVYAVNAIGSTSSSPMTITTAIAPPTAITFTNSQNSINITDFTLTWSGGVGATLYAFVLNDVSTVPSSSTSSSATFNGLLPATSYTVAITATNSSGSSSESSTVTTALPIFKDQWLSGVSYNQYDITVGQDSRAYSCVVPTSAQTFPLWNMTTSDNSFNNQNQQFGYNIGSIVKPPADVIFPIRQDGYKPTDLLLCIVLPTLGVNVDPSSAFVLGGNGYIQYWKIISADPYYFPSFWSPISTPYAGPWISPQSYSLDCSVNSPINNQLYKCIQATTTGQQDPSLDTSSWTLIARAGNEPSQVVDVVSSAITPTGFTVSWSGGLGATSYSYVLNGANVVPSTDNGVSSNSAVFTGLVTRTQYTLCVMAKNQDGGSSSLPTVITTITDFPTEPTNLVSSSISATGFTIAWTGNARTTSYTYTLNDIPVTPFRDNSVFFRNVIFTELIPSKAYTVIVTAINANGSSPSQPFTVTTSNPTQAPSIPVVSATDITSYLITLSWTGGQYATSYSYEMNGYYITPDINNGLTEKTVTFLNLNAKTSYTLLVTAINSIGNTDAIPFVVSTNDIPPPPPVVAITSVIISSITTTGFTVNWSGGDNSTSYTYLLNGRATTPSTDNGLSSKSAVFTDLTPGTMYILSITGSNILYSESCFPLPIVTTLSVPPTQPNGFAATSVTDSGFNVSWSGGDGATSYSYALNEIAATPSTDNGLSSKSVEFTGLLANTTYFLNVIATNSVDSVYSAPFAVTTLPVPPTQPTNFSATSVTDSGFSVSWSGGDGATSYSYVLNDVAATPSTDNGVSSNSAVFSGLVDNTSYTLIVTATNINDSSTSNPFTVTTLVLPPTQPTNFSATSVTDSGFTVIWSGGDGATSYTYALNNVAVTPSTDNGVSFKSAVFTGLLPSTSYTVTVTATNANGSLTTTPFNVTTLVAPPTQPTNADTTSVTDTGFTVIWSGGDGATSYTYVLNDVAVTPSTDNGVSSKSAVFTGLLPLTSYTVTVTATNANGSLTTTPFNVTTLPSPPPTAIVLDNFNAVIDITASGFTLVWTGGDGATSYSYDVTDPSGGVYVPSTDNGVSGKTAIFTGLPSTTAFTIFLTAINMTGSTTSDQYITTTSGTLTPNTVVVDLVQSGYSLTWSGGDGAVSYSYSVTDVCGNVINPMLTDNGISSKSALFQDFPGLYSSITIITATDSSGNTASSEPIYATTGPAPVGNFSVSSVTDTEFTIHWIGGGISQATSYTYLLNGVPTIPSIDNGVESQSATFSGLTPGHTYSVIVSVVNGTLSTPSTYTPGTSINLSSNFVALPYGLAIDQSNNLYISTYGPPCTLISVTPTGTTITLAGTTNQALSSYGLCYNAARSLLIQPDFGNHRVFLYDLSGNVTALIGGGGNGSTPGNDDGPDQSSTYMSPSAAVADLAGNTYILDAGNNNIRILDTSNITTTFVSGFNAPMGITIDSLGNLYVADTGYHCIKKITTDGTVSVYAGLLGIPGSTNSSVATHAYFNSPSGLTCDASDNIIVADTGNNIIRVILTSGEVITYAGTGATGFFTGYLLSSTFNGPWDVKLDSTGANLYVTDSQNNGLRVLPYNLMRYDICTVTTSEPSSVPPQIPITPLSLTASSITESGFTVSWTGGDNANIYSYTLDSIPTTPISSLEKSASFGGCSLGTTYVVTVIAMNDVDTQNTSINIKTLPNIPSVKNSTLTDTTITLEWVGGDGADYYLYKLNDVSTTPSVDNALSSKSATFSGLTCVTPYTISITAVNSGGSSQPSLTTLTTAPAAPSGASYTSTETTLTLSWSGGEGADSYSYVLNDVSTSPSIDNGVASKSATFSGLTFNTPYIISITAVSAGGLLSSSTSITATTAPGAPSGFSYTATNTTVILSWTGGEGANSYSYTLNGVDTVPSTDNGVSGQTAEFTDLTIATSYTIGVTAINVENSPSSTSLTTVTTVPSTPSSLSYTATDTTVTVSWSDGATATSYSYALNSIPTTPSTDNGVASKSASFSGLSQATTYMLDVIAINAGGSSTTSAYVTTAPGAPSGFSYTATDTTVSLAWAAGTGATSYSYTLNGVNTVPSTDNGIFGQTAEFTYLTIATSYTIGVTAINDGGSSTSLTTVTTVPSTPSSLSYTATDTTVTVSWSDGATATSYSYVLNGVSTTPSTDNGVASKSASFSGLSQATTYTLDVIAINAGGSSMPSSTSVTTAPGAPSGFSYTATDTTVSLSWAAGTGATSYSYTLNGVSTTPSTDNGVSGQTAEFTGLTIGTSYIIGVTAINDGGSSTTLTNVTTIPSTPSSLSYTATDTSITLSWSDGTTATSYSYTLNGNAVVPSINNGVSGRNATFSGLTSTTTYTLGVRAINAVGSSPLSTKSVTTDSLRPINLTYTIVPGGGIKVSWSGGYGAISYWYRLNGGIKIPDIDNGISGKNATFSANSYITTNTTYTIDVIAFNTNKKGIMMCVGSYWAEGGEQSMISYTYDGIDWLQSGQLYRDPTIHRIRSIATNNNSLFLLTAQTVASNLNYNIYSSTDGLNWTVSHTGPSYMGVVYGNSLWIAWGYTTIVYSYDGLNWTTVPWNSTIFPGSINKIIWTGTRWIAVGSGTNSVAYSSDGITWSKSISGNAAFSGASITAIHNHGDLVLAGGNRFVYSTDSGITWTISASLPMTYIYAIKWNGTVWMMTGQGATTASNIKYSTDGVTWTNAPGASYFNNNGNTLVNSPTLNIAFGSSDGAASTGLYSTDGIHWSQSFIYTINIMDGMYTNLNELTKNTIVVHT